MLRTSIALRHQLLSISIRQPPAGQWLVAIRPGRPGLSERNYAQAREPASSLQPSSTLNTVVNLGVKNATGFATSTTPSSSRDPSSRSPPSPSSESAIPPESVPKAPPSPTFQGQTSPGSSVPPLTLPSEPASSPSAPPPPQLAAEKPGRLRRFFVFLFLATGLAYAGGVWFSLRSDNFHDFFTEYIPFGEEAVLYLEERDFRRRFPNATKHIHRRASVPRDEGTKVTIPSKSGLTSKVSEGKPDGTGLVREEKNTDVVDAIKLQGASRRLEPANLSPVAEKLREDNIPKTNKVQQETAVKLDEKEVPKKGTPEQTKAEVRGEPREATSTNVTTVELLKISDGDEPVVQDLVKVFNNVITIIGGDESAAKFSDTISKAKDEVGRIRERITALREDAHAAAEEKIKEAHTMFDKSATELIRRIDEIRAQEAAQFREEFEAEREKLSQSYQEKIKTELERAHEVAEQRLRNELVEQAIELNRKFLSDVRSLVEKERDGRLSKLSELALNVSELENLTADWNSVIDINLKTQQLQVAVDAVRTALDGSDMPKPFVRELVAVKELASEDPVVTAAIASINPTAYQRGIPSPGQIVDRFRRVANEVRKARLLPEDAGIASHAASFLLSKVMFKKQGLADGDDVESVLTRTESYLEEGNFDKAAREMNTLQGWAKLLSKDWLADVRRVLEVRQALEVIETEARLRCLQVE